MEVIDAMFYQATRAYLVGRVLGAGTETLPLALALRNTEAGVGGRRHHARRRTSSASCSAFARSYFHVDLERVAERWRS